MVTFAWVAGGIVVLVGLIALSDLLGGRRASKALLRRPPQDPREQARIIEEHASGLRGSDGFPGGGVAAHAAAARARQAAQLCRDAGADPAAIPAWVEEGRRRAAQAGLPPFSGGLRAR